MRAAAKSRAGSWSVLLPPLVFVVVYGIHTPGEPTLNPDSAGYLDFAASRTGGYPFFLARLKPFVRDVADYAIAQRVLYAGAVLLLSHQLLLLLERPAVTAIAALALLFNPEVNRYHFAIFTESLFLSVSALFFAAAFAHIRTGSRSSLAAASAAVGALVAIRPTGFAFIPVLLVLAVAQASTVRPSSYVAQAVAALLPLAAVIALEHAYYSAHHSGSRQSLAAVIFFAKAGMAGRPAQPVSAASAELERLFGRLNSDAEPVRRLVSEAPNLPAQCVLGAAYEAYLQYQYLPQERSAVVAKDGAKSVLDGSLAELRRNPGGALSLAARHHFCLWTLGAAGSGERAAMQSYIDSRRPLPFEAAVQPAIAGARLPPFGNAARWIMGVVAALTAASAVALCASLAMRRRAGALLTAAGLCGMATHGAFLLTALAAIGLPRYALGLWVPLTLGAGLSALWLFGLFWELSMRRVGAPPAQRGPGMPEQDRRRS